MHHLKPFTIVVLNGEITVQCWFPKWFWIVGQLIQNLVWIFPNGSTANTKPCLDTSKWWINGPSKTIWMDLNGSTACYQHCSNDITMCVQNQVEILNGFNGLSVGGLISESLLGVMIGTSTCINKPEELFSLKLLWGAFILEEKRGGIFHVHVHVQYELQNHVTVFYFCYSKTWAPILIKLSQSYPFMVDPLTASSQLAWWRLAG